MKKLRLVIILLALVLVENLFSQLSFKISTVKASYNYGEIISLSCSVSNNSDSTLNILVYNYNSCQAEFEFDDYQSKMWTTCFPSSQELFFASNTSRKYNWTIDPKRFGLPNKNGTHKMIGHFRYSPSPYSTSNIIELKDTLYMEAPMFLGGQLVVGFTEENDSLASGLKDSLKAELIKRDAYPWGITETWQILGINLDSLFNKLEKDYRLNYVEYNRQIQYDSISTITSVENINTIIDKYYLGDAYPNPFNPTSRFYLQIPKTEEVNIELYNILGEKVSTIYKGVLNGNMKYSFEINANYLASGVYYYTVYSSNYYKSKKIILLK